MKFGISYYSREQFFWFQYLKVCFILLYSISFSWSMSIETINNEKKYVPVVGLVANGKGGQIVYDKAE